MIAEVLFLKIILNHIIRMLDYCNLKKYIFLDTD